MEQDELRFIESSLERRLGASQSTGRSYGVKFYGVEEEKLDDLRDKLSQIDPALQVVVLNSLGDAKQNSLTLQSLQNSSGERKENIAVITTSEYDEQLKQSPNSEDAGIFTSFVSPYGDLLNY